MEHQLQHGKQGNMTAVAAGCHAKKSCKMAWRKVLVLDSAGKESCTGFADYITKLMLWGTEPSAGLFTGDGGPGVEPCLDTLLAIVHCCGKYDFLYMLTRPFAPRKCEAICKPGLTFEELPGCCDAFEELKGFPCSPPWPDEKACHAFFMSVRGGLEGVGAAPEVSGEAGASWT